VTCTIKTQARTIQNYVVSFDNYGVVDVLGETVNVAYSLNRRGSGFHSAVGHNEDYPERFGLGTDRTTRTQKQA
jgi:hypothetical protein